MVLREVCVILLRHPNLQEICIYLKLEDFMCILTFIFDLYYSRMRSKGFPFNCGGLGAGGVFTRCFGLRPREGPMAGPLGNAPERGPGGRKRGGRADGNEGGHSGSRICLVLFFTVLLGSFNIFLNILYDFILFLYFFYN